MGTNYGGWPQAGMRVPAGRMLVVDDACVYGFGRNQYIHHGAHVGIDGATIFHFRADRDDPRRQTYYQAFAISRHGPAGGPPPAKPQPKRGRRPASPAKKYLWTQKMPILVRAMVLTPDTLFLAGPPDWFATDDPIGSLRGTQGGTLIAVSPSEGNKLADYRLESPPVFDGMAAAGGRLYLATTGGQIVCFGQK